MSDTHESTSSLPDLPPDNSHGSSVSLDFVNEYDELLKYAIVAPRFIVEPSAYIEKDLSGNHQDKELIKDQASDEKDVSFKVNPNYKVELKILEAKKAVEKTPQHDTVQFNIPNALESLFGTYLFVWYVSICLVRIYLFYLFLWFCGFVSSVNFFAKSIINCA